MYGSKRRASVGERRRAFGLATMAGVLVALALSLALAPSTSGYAAEAEGPTTVYRLYNEWSGEHHYTGDLEEIASLEGLGWDNEGVAWYSPRRSSSPVWRLYNEHTLEHLYTASRPEADHLTGSGWTMEGVSWYSDDAHTRPVYRLYNPNVKGAGAHHYTMSENEYRTLAAIGWTGEGTAWWGLYRPEAEAPDAPQNPDVPGEDPTAPDTPSGEGEEGAKPKPPTFDTTPPQTNETIDVEYQYQLGDTDHRGYTYSNFTHREVKASAWVRRPFDACMDMCAGCGQMFSNLYDPSAISHLNEHLSNRTKAMREGTTTERGGTNYQDTTVNLPVATAYTTTDVVDFTCWRTPDGRHDPSCTNPDHVVKPDVDEKNPVDISNVTVTLDAQSYDWNNNKAILPKVTVTYGGQTLVEDTNYQYLKNRSEGDFHVVYYFNRYKPYNQSGETPYLVVVGQNAYKGTKVVPIPINYPPEKPNVLYATVNGDLSNLTIARWGLYDYGWLFNEPVPTLTLNGKTLTYGRDFDVELRYGGSIPSDCTTKGTRGFISVIFVGCGQYEGRLPVEAYATIV